MFRYLRSRIAAASGQEGVHLLAILCSEGDRSRLRLASSQRLNWKLETTGSWDQAIPLFASGRYAVIVCDRDLPDRNWRQTVRDLAKLSPCVLLASAGIDASLWQEVVQCGGHDVIAKPLEERGVLKTIDQALRYTSAVKR